MLDFLKRSLLDLDEEFGYEDGRFVRNNTTYI